MLDALNSKLSNMLDKNNILNNLMYNFGNIFPKITLLLFIAGGIHFIIMFSLATYVYKSTVQNIDTTYKQVIKNIETNASKYDRDTCSAKISDLEFKGHKASFDQLVSYKEYIKVTAKQSVYYLVILLVILTALIIIELIFLIFDYPK